MFNNRYRQRIIFIGLLLAVSFGACKKSFIDGQKPTNSGSADQVFASASSVRSYLTGVYRNLRLQWQSTDGTAGGGDETYSYNSIFLTRDVKGKDITMARANWYFYDYQNDNREPAYRRVRFTWYYFYELINQVNTLIDGTQKSATIPADDKARLIAEACALRAFFYFELAREFQLSYGKDPSAPGVPIYTTPSNDTTTGHPRGTLQQTYDQINSDIGDALQHLSTPRTLKDQVNINVAWGLAARIYLEQGRWADAESAAVNAMNGYALDPGGYHNNYNGLTSSEVIWGLPQTLGNGGQSLYYGTPSSLFDQTPASAYHAFWMSEDLVSKFSLSDVRFTFFQTGPDPAKPNYCATNKFGKGNGTAVTLLNGQTVEQNSIDFEESINMMRVGEMYLIQAEALARQNKEADAQQVLFGLQKDRDNSLAGSSGNTGQALIDEILLERRKELYGEMGVDWLDAKRLQLPIDRTGSNHAPALAYVIPANDPRFNLKIPQSEMQANKSLKPGDQNP